MGHLTFTKVRSDDILVSGTSDEDHLRKLDRVLTELERHGLKLKKKKCEFMKDEVVFLGFKLDKKGISPVMDKVRQLLDAHAPENVTQLKSFLGMLNYYHCYMPSIAMVLEPLHQLLRKDIKWNWDEKLDKAFCETKKLLCRTKILVYYDPRKDLMLQF